MHRDQRFPPKVPPCHALSPARCRCQAEPRSTEQFSCEITSSSTGSLFIWRMCNIASYRDGMQNIQDRMGFAEVFKHFGVTVNFSKNCVLLVLVMFERNENVGKVIVVRAGEFAFQDYSSKFFSITALKMCLSHIISVLYIIFTLEIIILPAELHVVNYLLGKQCT